MSLHTDNPSGHPVVWVTPYDCHLHLEVTPGALLCLLLCHGDTHGFGDALGDHHRGNSAAVAPSTHGCPLPHPQRPPPFFVGHADIYWSYLYLFKGLFNCRVFNI